MENQSKNGSNAETGAISPAQGKGPAAAPGADLPDCPFCGAQPERDREEWVRHPHNDCPISDIYLHVIAWSRRAPAPPDEAPAPASPAPAGDQEAAFQDAWKNQPKFGMAIDIYRYHFDAGVKFCQSASPGTVQAPAAGPLERDLENLRNRLEEERRALGRAEQSLMDLRVALGDNGVRPIKELCEYARGLFHLKVRLAGAPSAGRPIPAPTPKDAMEAMFQAGYYADARALYEDALEAARANLPAGRPMTWTREPTDCYGRPVSIQKAEGCKCFADRGLLMTGDCPVHGEAEDERSESGEGASPDPAPTCPDCDCSPCACLIDRDETGESAAPIGEAKADPGQEEKCPRCGGTGKSPMWDGYKCSQCSGGGLDFPAQGKREG